MTYVRTERDEFLRRMTGVIAQAKNDHTSAADASRSESPPSDYARNLERMKDLTMERLESGTDPAVVLGGITANLMHPYKGVTEKRIADFKAAGATDRECIDALLEAYQKA